jgi:hypothetical protein
MPPLVSVHFAFFSHINPVLQSVTVPSPFGLAVLLFNSYLPWQSPAVVCTDPSGKLIVPVPDKFRFPLTSTPAAAYDDPVTTNIKMKILKDNFFPNMTSTPLPYNSSREARLLVSHMMIYAMQTVKEILSSENMRFLLKSSLLKR